MSKMMKAISVIPSMLLAAAIMLPSCRHSDESASEQEPVLVRTINVTPTADIIGSTYVGRVEPSKSTVLLSRFSGTVDNLEAVKGRRVTKGTVLATVNSETVNSAYEIAKASLEQAEDGYARASKVYESGSVTEVKMVEIRTQLEQARSAEKSARQALEECKIIAPFTGVIGDVNIHKGERVTAAQPVIQILDVESVEIHFNVPEGEYASIELGAKAAVEISALNRKVTGTVAVKGVSASALSHAYDFTLKNISDSYQMMPGMTCKVRIENVENSSFVIPASAVMTDMEGRYVWGVTGGDTVSKVYVTVSGYSGNGVVISDGLAEGDKVITEGSSKVSTGMKVKTQE